MKVIEALNKIAAWHDGEVGPHMDSESDAATAREALAALEASRATPEELARARAEYADPSDNGIEIDDDAQTSRTDDGVWVQAWVWLQDEGDEA